MSKKELKVCWLSAGVSSFVEEKIKKENIPVIFYESLSEGTVAKSIAKDTNITPLVFSSVHTVSSEDIQNGATYISVVENNLNNLKKALN